MGNFNECPITEKDTIAHLSSTGLSAGATGMQGWRAEMEDAHIACDMPSLPDHIFLAVFDGHGGSGAAHFAEKHMIECIEKTAQWQAYLKSGANNVEMLGEALINGFEDLDAAMRVHQSLTSGKDTSGCTSVTAMITPRHILCANAGDSRCVLGTNNMAKGLSEDHKPFDEIEKRRIEHAGGTVQWKRVDGDLAVSRALGDFQFKNNQSFPAKEQKVTFLPDITVHERSPEDDVLLLACDGLWDVMSNSESIDLIRKLFQTGETQTELVAEEMVELALEKGSRDNISAIVLLLDRAKIGNPGTGGVAASRAARRDNGLDPSEGLRSK